MITKACFIKGAVTEASIAPAISTSSHSVTTIAIVEDNTAIRREWSNILKGWSGYLPNGEFRTGEEALKQLLLAPPDFVLMDINLPSMSGIECTRELKRLLPNVQIFMLTMFRDGDRVFDALCAGASGYFLKRVRPADLHATLEDAKAGGSHMTPYIARQIVKYFQNTPFPLVSRMAEDDKSLDALSPQESEVVRLLAGGCQYTEIADKMEFSVDIVRKHIRRIYQKLHLRCRKIP